MDNTQLDAEARLLRRLRRPEGMVDVVLDTDTYNEIDDQFALAYLILSPEKLRLRGIHAAPFHNDRSAGPGDGMEKSYQEIEKVLRLMGRSELFSMARRGSDRYLPSETEPVDSPAARHLIELSQSYSAESPLCVAAIGAITNVASALLLDPTLCERIFIVWLGGNGLDMGQCREFNLMQDVAAARVVFQSGAPLVVLPASGVTSHLSTTKPELEYYLRGKNPLCDYLADNTINYTEQRATARAWSKVVWDIAAIAWLLDPRFVADRVIRAPIPQYDLRYSTPPDGMPVRWAYGLDRDLIFSDLFAKLTESGEE